jgi:hypothetical protein
VLDDYERLFKRARVRDRIDEGVRFGRTTKVLTNAGLRGVPHRLVGPQASLQSRSSSVERSGESTVDVLEGSQESQDRLEVWLWSIAVEERSVGLNRCLGLLKASGAEEVRHLGLRS